MATDEDGDDLPNRSRPLRHENAYSRFSPLGPSGCQTSRIWTTALASNPSTPIWAHMDKSILVTREQLYEQVWTIPTQTLAKQYGISDVGLSKICRRLNVPKPGLGYWGKIDAGHRLPRTPLPARALEHSYEIRPRPPEPVETEEQRLAREAHERLRQSFAAVSVPDVLSQPHSLTRKTQEHFATIAKKLQKPLRKTSSFERPQLASLPYDQKGRYECKIGSGFPLLVSLPHIDRALRILDTWTKEIIKLGFELRADEKKNELSVWKDAQGFTFTLREGYRKHEFAVDEQKARKDAGRYPNDYEWIGSDRFTFTISGPIWGTHREWSDGKSALQVRMPEMLAEIVELVPLARKLRAEEEQKKKAQAEEEHRRWQAQTRRDEEKRQLDNIVEAAGQVARAEAALRYLDQLEAEYFKVEGSVPEPVALWFNRARDIAVRSNPMKSWIEELRAKAPRNSA